MRIGLISPYSFDAPGGVQFHIQDLAEELQRRGHFVSVLAPAEDDTELPDYVTSGGKAIPVKYNGSVARLCFGPRAAAKTKRWLTENQFDLIHPHEPINPSLAMLAVWQTTTPVVATFHSSQLRSRALQVAVPMLKPNLNKIDARIAVSEDARRTVIDHLGGDAVLIPNGVSIDKFTQAEPNPNWASNNPTEPVIAFLGRLDEPRKGLSVLVAAIPEILKTYPKARFLIAGNGEAGRAAAEQTLGSANQAVTFLGSLTDTEKAELLKSADLYVAPQTGGESFGIVLIEAMSAGTAVVASDLGAFRRVLADGKAGALFPVGDSSALAATIVELLNEPAKRVQLIEFANTWVKQFDWENVTGQILAVYETVLASAQAHALV